MTEALEVPQKKVIFSDLTASFVVFLTALPLSMGIAVASGVPAIWGLFSAIVGALVAGIISGVPLQINGPSPGLIVISIEIIHKFGLEGLGLIVCAAGILQFLAGQFKLAQLFRAISPSVIQGMLAGIGVLIILSQFYLMIDHSAEGTGLNYILGLPGKIFLIFTGQETQHQIAAGIGILTIFIILFWKSLCFMKPKLRIIPASLMSVVIGTAVAQYFNLPITYVSMPSEILSVIEWPMFSSWPGLLSTEGVIFSIIALTFVSSAETSLVSIAITRMAKLKQVDYDQSLVSIGIGNTLCGLFGILPVSGIIVRSMVNVESGAKSKMSSLFLGLWTLVFVAFFPNLLTLLPMSCLAGVLVYTGFKLIDFQEIKRIWNEYGPSEVAIFALTLGTIVLHGLLSGIIVGFVLAAFKTLYIFTHLDIHKIEDPETNKIDIYLEGSATFVRLPKLASAIENAPPNSEVHIHIDHLAYIDHACLEFLMSWEEQHVEDNGRLIIDWDSLKVRFHTKNPVAKEAPISAGK